MLIQGRGGRHAVGVIMSVPPRCVGLSVLADARESFLRTGTVHPRVREPVGQAWVRSGSYGLDPHNIPRQQLDRRRLGQAQKAARRLLEAASPAMAQVHEVLGGEPHMIALSDASGLILRMHLGGLADECARSRNLFEGASWHERNLGSNGIGTALASEEPVCIAGPAHFADEYLGWTCVGVPLRTADGRLAGALDLSLPTRRTTPHAWGWALSVASTIEAALARLAQDGERRPVDGWAEAQSRLHGRDGARDEALAGLAHELRNPLNAMSLLLDLAERTPPDPARMNDLTARLRRQTNRLTRFMNDLGDVIRSERGALLVNKEEVDLNEVVRSAIEATAPELERRRHRLEVRLASQILTIDGDAGRLEQVLVNLLTNAAKYTPAGGRIAVQSEGREREAIVRVRDTGHGIAGPDLQRIFERFTRVVPHSGDPGGMGLGLALVKELVGLHQGTVLARSDGPGRGSEFEVRLPRMAARAEALVAHAFQLRGL
jgi:signal transduction histidine kinase